MAVTDPLKRSGPQGRVVAEPAPSPALAPPPGNPRFPLFDGLRGIGMLAVLGAHAGELTGRWGSGLDGRFIAVAGPEAVYLFFSFSGFLIYRPYVSARVRRRPPVTTATYAKRRALRVLPIYWFALTLLAIYPGIPGVFTEDWWRYYGFLQIYSTRTLGSGIAVAWTLCVEVTFYLALPLWALLMRRLATGRRWIATELAALAVVGMAGAIVQVAGARGWVNQPVSTSLAAQCLWFAVGMSFAVVSVAIQCGELRPGAIIKAIERRSGALWLAGAGALAGLMALVPAGGVFGLIALAQGRSSADSAVARVVLETTLMVILLAPVVFGDNRTGLPRRLLRLRPLVYLGVISYSFYLWHFTILELIASPGRGSVFSAPGLNLVAHLHTARPLILFLLGLAATVAISSATYRWIELPFLRRK